MISSTEFLLVKVLGSIVVPPGSNIILALLGLLILPFARRFAALVMFVAVGSLYAFSTVTVAVVLERGLYDYPALSPGTDLPAAGAIVVLGGGGNHVTDIEGRYTAGSTTLERVRYAASLYRRTKLPLLMTGGGTVSGMPAEAGLMARSLKNDFGIDVRFVESRSRNTAENAAYSAALLAEARITRIVLVTHATHMSRAVDVFERQGLKVVPAPVVMGDVPLSIVAFLPRADALVGSASAIREYVGRLWYRVRY